MTLLKTCFKCKETKPTDDFSKNRTRKDGLQCTCKACLRLACAEWYQKNSDKVKKAAKAWNAKNPDKARANNRRHTRTHTESLGNSYLRAKISRKLGCSVAELDKFDKDDIESFTQGVKAQILLKRAIKAVTTQSTQPQS